MSIDGIEAEVLKLHPQGRARSAKKLLESLEALSDEENERLWAEEAHRRDAGWDSASGSARPAADVLRDARAKLKLGEGETCREAAYLSNRLEARRRPVGLSVGPGRSLGFARRGRSTRAAVFATLH